MKKLKKRLERKITDIISSVILWCDGKGYFKISTYYRFPLTEKYYLEINKNQTTISISYRATLKEEGRVVIIDTEFVYDVFRKDVPFQKAYTLHGTRVREEVDNVVGLKNLLGQLNEEIRKKS